MDDKLFKSIFIEIKGADKSILYGTIYRSPNADVDANSVFQDYLKKCISKLRKSKKCVLYKVT